MGSAIIPSSPAPSCWRSNIRNRSARAPAGARCTSSSRRRGRARRRRPSYVKSHSQGEYVFDHGWADAYERAGGRYYPSCRSPCRSRPPPGRAFSSRRDAPREARARSIAGAARPGAADESSSIHVTFAPEGRSRRAGALRAWLQRTDQQFHLVNDGYAISTISSPRWPRASARPSSASGARRWATSIRSTLTGADLTRDALGRLLRLLQDTGAANGAGPISPAVLLADRRDGWPSACCW